QQKSLARPVGSPPPLRLAMRRRLSTPSRVASAICSRSTKLASGVKGEPYGSPFPFCELLLEGPVLLQQHHKRTWALRSGEVWSQPDVRRRRTVPSVLLAREHRLYPYGWAIQPDTRTVVRVAVLFQFAEFGCLEDVALGLRWRPADFAAQVRNRANALAAADVKAGSTVILARSGSAPFLADLFAVWTLGAAAACIDPALTKNEIQTLVEFVQPSALLVGDVAIAARINVRALELDQVAGSTTAPAPIAPSNPNDPALILFTSGTTGRPKGVVLTFHAILTRVALNRAAIGGASRMRTLVTLPTSFGHGLIGNALTPLLSGGDIVLHPLGQRLAGDLGRIIDEFRIGFLSSVPAFWRMALKFSAAPSKNELARIHVGSAPLGADLWARIVEWSRAEVVNCYGITELANWVAGASARTEGIADGLVGKPWGVQAAIKDSSGTRRETGEGELVIKSPSVMSGYLRRPDLTAA